MVVTYMILEPFACTIDVFYINIVFYTRCISYVNFLPLSTSVVSLMFW